MMRSGASACIGVKAIVQLASVQGYVQTALHTYTDADGSALYWRIRMEHPQKTGADRKFIRPFHLNGGGYLIAEPEFPNGKPLYGLHLLAQRPDHVVWFVEGEGCAMRCTRRVW